MINKDAEVHFVRKEYFVSPVYVKAFIKAFKNNRGCLDENDFFDDWIRKSTFNASRKEFDPNAARIEWLGWTGYIMGENGVLCRLRDNVISMNNDGNVCYDGVSEAGPEGRLCSLYKRVIEVESTPAAKELPKELTDLLENRGYKRTIDHAVLHYSRFE